MQQTYRLVGVLLAAVCMAPLPPVRLAAAGSGHALAAARQQMVDQEIVAAGVTNARVIAALRQTPRHEFVPLRQRKYAYYDMALPIGAGQTISPPFVVAYMTEQIDPRPDDRVLEIGTGSGYQAAVLSRLVAQVYTIEIVESLGRRAAQTLRRLHYNNVHCRIGDGYQGWPEQAPFDKIIVTCSPEKVPTALIAQLREGGLMVVPVGARYQQTLYLFHKHQGRLVAKALLPTLFVPMTGAAERGRHVQPDPSEPTLVGGSFETLLDKTVRPRGWHYVRQMDVVSGEAGAASGAPDGRRYARFVNRVPGRGSQALQGFAVDGRQVAQLDMRLWVRGKDLRFGQNRQQWPGAVVTFYDQHRATVGQASMGPWLGTFAWRREAARLAVPLRAREAIVRIGLLGAIGELAVDAVQIHRAKTARHGGRN